MEAPVTLPDDAAIAAVPLPTYAAAMAVCIPMCVRASRLPLREGEQLLKRSIYVLLVGMVGGLVLGNVK